MERKKLQEMNLMDNFLFWTMVSYPGIGEPFVRSILETTFGQKFGKLTVIPERSYPGSDTDLHGARLDVYVENPVETEKTAEIGTFEGSAGIAGTVEAELAEGSAGVAGTVEAELAESSVSPAGIVEAEMTESFGEIMGTGSSAGYPVAGRAVVYDLEPDNNSEKRGALPRRVRFYHSKIDSFSLQSGKGYDALKDVFVVMILSYDPFGQDRMVYTIKNWCREQPDLEYEDGATTIFLYTKGKKGRASEELKQLLRYFEKSTEGNAVNETLKEVHRMVETVKRDGEVTMKYLRIMEHERDLIEQGIEQGIEKGIERGIKQGRQEERNNTEREKRRADAAETRADVAEKELLKLRKELEKLRAV